MTFQSSLFCFISVYYLLLVSLLRHDTPGNIIQVQVMTFAIHPLFPAFPLPGVYHDPHPVRKVPEHFLKA